MDSSIVALFISSKLKYPVKVPYHPDKNYPELQTFFGKMPIDPDNHVYSTLRKIFKTLKLDTKNYDTKMWNPLSEIIKPGDKVLLKPNFVMHEYGPQAGQNAMHTHGSVIRAIADYALLALKGKGELIIADAPCQHADYDILQQECGLPQMKDWYAKAGVKNFLFYELRKEWAVLSPSAGKIVKRVSLSGDPRGLKTVDLGTYSSLEPITSPDIKFSISNYDDLVTQNHHHAGKHQYLIGQTILDADVIINIPKLKSHMKSGLTCCLKNLVGINVSKDYLPHYRAGSAAEGGDEFPEKTVANMLFKKVRDSFNERAPLWLWKIIRFFGLPFRRLYSNVFDKSSEIPTSLINTGNWYGNDTCWRMVHDMNKITFYADKNGIMKKDKQRKYFAFVDAIIAGEGNGPLTPVAKHCGMLLAGVDPLEIDTVAAVLMGFDPKKISLLTKYDRNEAFPFSKYEGFPKKINISNLNEKECLIDFNIFTPVFNFIPPTGWQGHIELKSKKE